MYDERSIRKDIILNLLDEFSHEISPSKIASVITTEISSIIINKQDKSLKDDDFDSLVGKLRNFFKRTNRVTRFKSFSKDAMEEGMLREFLCNTNINKVAKTIGKIIDINDSHVIVNPVFINTYKSIAKSTSTLGLLYGNKGYQPETPYFEDLGKDLILSNDAIPNMWRWTPRTSSERKMRSNFDYCMKNQCLAFDVNIGDMNRGVNLYDEYIINEDKDDNIAKKVVDQCFEFKKSMNIGDIVIATEFSDAEGYSIIAWGTTKGDYFYYAKEEYKHQRFVEWHIIDKQPLLIKGNRKCLFEQINENYSKNIFTSIQKLYSNIKD